MFVAVSASAIEGPGSSCSSSISEDESAIELFFHLLMPRYLPHSLPQLTRKSPPLPWLTPGKVSTGGRGDRNCKEPCLLFLRPTYGVCCDSNKGTIGEECGLWTRVFHAEGVTLVEVGLT
ncbi:hypothetical protein AVEN_169827-1 [Araneus ventricosus]|uniref:Uncharacterized protein n=1 Tax=Araneus ventricosus TaxID=182803 RepID=A0A4Y2H763_ARAVE|nr:hypothetical protein AVEN_140291-1 [Araneus ventricosus]GBM60164.1 hypothetical protein AVEN_169827-1 [Araneus ventricosus]